MYHGIINIYKEKGFTSHDVVAVLRGILKQKKIGHTGTLDPEATGVLPVCLGKGTKVAGLLTDKEKVYRAEFILGSATDTEDHTGEMIKEMPWEQVTESQVLEAIEHFVGDIEQVPPMYSAIKVKGKKLYELAREGVTIERKTRPVTIISIDHIETDLPKIRMTVKCSKGTYIRSLCRDIAEALGTCGHMTSLERTASGQFDKTTAMTLDQVRKMAEMNRVDQVVYPIDSVFSDYQTVKIKRSYYKLLDNGNKVPETSLVSPVSMVDEGRYNVYNEEDDYMGIYRWSEKDGLLIPVKFFNIRK